MECVIEGLCLVISSKYGVHDCAQNKQTYFIDWRASTCRASRSRPHTTTLNARSNPTTLYSSTSATTAYHYAVVRLIRGLSLSAGADHHRFAKAL